MSDTPKTISRSTYLQALGLFTLASAHMRRVEETQKELCSLLGYDWNESSHVEDAIYEIGGGTSFDEALRKQNITVEEAPTSTTREGE